MKFVAPSARDSRDPPRARGAPPEREPRSLSGESAVTAPRDADSDRDSNPPGSRLARVAAGREDRTERSERPRRSRARRTRDRESTTRARPLARRRESRARRSSAAMPRYFLEISQ